VLNDGIFFFSLASHTQYWKVRIEKKIVIEKKLGVYPKNQSDFKSCSTSTGISGRHLPMNVVCQFFVVSQVWNKCRNVSSFGYGTGFLEQKKQVLVPFGTK
jgi:hypothetical protein